MKRRVLAVILGMTMVCSMAACGGSSGEKENSESTKEDSGKLTFAWWGNQVLFGKLNAAFSVRLKRVFQST